MCEGETARKKASLLNKQGFWSYHVPGLNIFLLHALGLWHCYLENMTLTVTTDHSENVFFANKKQLSPRQKR